jgi:hypothetical protein
MKGKINKILWDFAQSKLTQEEVTQQVLDLFAVSSSVCHCNNLPHGEIAISSRAIQKPYGDLGQTDC